MELDFSKKEKIVGIFVISVLILLLATIVNIGRGKNWFKKNVIYYTSFDEGYNLKPNAAVKLFNADIGKVKQIVPVKDKNKVRVELAILEEYASRIRTDTIAVVESPTFIGSEYVSIKPGKTDAPLIMEKGEIKSEAKKSIADMMNEFEVEKTLKMFIKAVQDLAETIHLLRDPQGSVFTALNTINRILTDIENIINHVEEGKGSLGNIIKSDLFIQDIMARIDQLNTILQDFKNASSKAPDIIENVNNTVIKAELLEENILKGVQDIQIIINEVKNSISNIMLNVEKGSNDFPDITNTTKKGIQEIRDGVEDIDKVFKSLQKNILIRPNIPKQQNAKMLDSNLRQ